MTGKIDDTESSYDDVVDGLSAEQAEELSEDVMVTTPEGEVPASAVLVDLVIMHQDLSDYRSASLAMTQAVRERRQKAEKNGNAEAVALLSELEETAYGAYLRCQYGDYELLGDGDGEHSDYFDTDGDGNGTS